MRIATIGVHSSDHKNFKSTNLRYSFRVSFLSKRSVHTIALERQYAMRTIIARDIVATANEERNMFIDDASESTFAVPAA